MNLSRKQSAWTAGILGLAAFTGWWAGNSSGRERFHRAPGHAFHQAAGADSDSKSLEPTRSPTAAAAAPGLSKEEVLAIQQELRDLFENQDLEELMKDQDPLLSFRLLARLSCLFSKLSKEQQEEVLGEVPEEDRGEAAAMVRMFSAMMPDTKPKTGIEYAKELATAKGDFGRVPVMVKWATTDTDGFLKYWKTEVVKPDAPKWLREEIGTVFWELSAADPHRLMREAMSMEDPELRKILLNVLRPSQFYSDEKSEWTADKDQLLKQLLTEKPDRQESGLSMVISKRLKHETVEEARAWVESLELGPQSKEWTDRAVFDAWRGQDRAAAAKWMLEQTPPEQRAERIGEYVSWWTDAEMPEEVRKTSPEPDIAGCADWIVSLGIGPETEKGISVLADGWIQAGEPAAALAWAQAIPDAATRASCLEKVTTQIERRYPDTWRAMLAAAGLPAAE